MKAKVTSGKVLLVKRYSYNILISQTGHREDIERYDTHPYSGTPEEFARAMLLDFLALNPELSTAIVSVNVWDSDKDGVGNPSFIIGQFSVYDLDEGPFPENQVEISYHTYYIVSAGYSDFDDDAVLGGQGTDVVYGMPYGLVVPGEGPALKIRTGHSDGWITLDLEALTAEPARDLEAWDAVEQATLRPTGALCVTNWNLEPAGGAGDLASLAAAEHVTIRVSARGRDTETPRYGSTHPRRLPVEHHRAQAWPVDGPAPRLVMKRDATTRTWESLG
jgi:hypothetical protein